MNRAIQKIIATNRKAYHEYFIDETYEAGLVLSGTEIKSVRGGKVSLREGYVKIIGGEAWLVDVHIAPYEHGGYFNLEPTRQRKLLLHRDEINRLRGKVNERGLTIVPLKLYLKGGLAKLELGLARGKRLHDKRSAIAEREAARQIERALKSR
ncbi:MAG: SsrA-binding protein SmpB [Chloroflexi bacterium]|nr:SsrA-binding protein SmpB [Chloroflexota bacterium]MDA8188457.1 SsrA-binding protein SmpB [Dehalococcoidales bacterium]